jgi:hypothetical protein
MSLIHRISAFAFCAAATAGIAASGCGTENPAESSASTSSVTVEHLDLGDGVQLDLMHDDVSGLMGMAVQGPESAKTRVVALAEVQGGVSEIYRAALPKSDVPATVTAFDLRTHEASQILADANNMPQNMKPLEPAGTLAFDSVSKSASSFPGQFCGGSGISSSFAISGWYGRVDGCYTNRTSDWTAQLDTVRQGYAALEMQVGTANLQSYWWNSSTAAWVKVHDIAIPQGYNNWVRLWQTNAVAAYYQFRVVGAAGDTYHVAIQSAETPIDVMANKNPTMTQKFRIRCGLTSPGGAVSDFYIDNKCLNQSSPKPDANGRDQPTHDQAFGQCQLLAISKPGYVATTANVSFQALPNTAGCRI